MPVRKVIITAAAMAVSGLAADAYAQTDTNAVTSGNWSDPATWDGGEPSNSALGGAAGQPTHANINGGHTVTINQPGETTLRLDLGTGANSGNVGHLAMTAGDLTISSADNIPGAQTSLRVAQEVGTTGTMTMSGGTINIAGGVGSDFAIGELMIGDNGDATLNMTGGTINAADEVFFGLGDASVSTVNMGGGTIAAQGRNVLVGFGGDATLNQTGGTISGADEVFVGFHGPSTSVANVSGGTLRSNGRSIIVGLFGNGTLNVSDAGTVRANWDLLVGLGNGSVGNVNLAGGTIEANYVFTNAFNVESGSTVNVTQTGGTFNCHLAFVLGQGNGTTTMTHSGGVINVLENNGDMVVGDGDFNTSTYNVSGSAEVNLLHNFIVGAFGGSNGIVNMSGGDISAADNVFVGRDGAGAWNQSGGIVAAPNTIIANVTGATGTLTHSGGVIQTANLTGGGGTSTLNLNGGTVRASADAPTWVGGGEGIDTVRVQAGGVTFDTNGFNAGIAVVLPHDAALAAADGGLTKTGAGTLTLSAANTYNGGTRVQGGTLLAANANAMGTGSLAVSNGATARLQAGLPTAVSVAGPLAMTASGATGGTLDITDNAVAVRHANQAAAFAGHTTVNNLTRNAFHDFGWDQPGVTSTTVATKIAGGIPAAIGILLNNDGGGNALFYGDGTSLPLFEGRSVGSNDVLVKETLLGDGDLNGVVDTVDFALFQAGYTNAAPYVGFAFGDYDYNGVVDTVDFGLFQAGYQYSQSNPPSPEMVAFATEHGLPLVAAVVPEPATFGLLALAGGGLMLRRRRRA